MSPATKSAVEPPFYPQDLDPSLAADHGTNQQRETLQLARRRRTWAIGLNLIAPGAGLVILRREWLGLTVAVLFAALAQLTVFAVLIEPSSTLSSGPLLLGIATGVVWLFGQLVNIVRAGRVLGERARQKIASIVNQVSRALAEQQYGDAARLLEAALAIDDECVDLRMAQARVLTVMGRFDQARVAWEAVLDLDVQGSHRAEAIGALDRLPT